MSAIFGETLTFGQEAGPDLRLTTFGDEFYARYENPAGYSVVYDAERGQWCYALVLDEVHLARMRWSKGPIVSRTCRGRRA